MGLVAQAADTPDSPAKLKATAERAFQLRDWNAAAEAYRKLLDRTTPNDGQAWFRLGYALQATGKLDAAIEAHQKALRDARFKSAALYNLACAWALKGKRDKALDHLQQAVEAGFYTPRPIDEDPDFKSLLKDKRFQELARRARPPSERPVYRQFDFWVGQWDVFNAAGKRIGRNTIEKQEGGFLLLERWANLAGSTGTSINYFDPQTKKWRQTWVDKGGGVLRSVGEMRSGKMEFEGDFFSAKGARAKSKMTIAPLPDGRVRQQIYRSFDGGKTWSTYFDGYYARRTAAPSKTTPSSTKKTEPAGDSK